MKRLLLAACIVSLTACGGGKDDVKSGYEDKIRASGQSLVYSFPLADQVEVPTPSPVVLRFTSAVTDPATANVRLLDANGQPVAASMTSVDGDRGLILTPDTPLNPLAHYTIDIPELALADGKSAARSLHFTTRGLHQGPATSVGADTFDVLRRFPDGQTLPVADLSSLRLQLSQPLDRNTVKYGDAADSTISLVDANGQLVPARVLVGDSYLTIDPVNDMVGGAQYTLKIATGSAGLKSSRGLTLPATGMGANAWSWSFTPEDTRPPASNKNPNRDRARMVQIIDDTPMDSPLTGKRVNLVPMYSVLLGTEGSANPATPQASGYLAAELAHIPEHDETTPLRIDRGSLIKASSLPIYIGGEVPAGFDSGQVYMEFLSDATGYLIENPYSTNPEAPKLVRLMMDMGISAEGDIANGSVTQTLLHIELVGTALVEDGLMTLNAVGVVQPNILGTERATAVLSFYMQGLDDQVNAPVPPVDERPLEVVSWTMEDQSATGGPNKALWANPSDPIIINFNRALDPESIVGKVKLLKTDNSGTDVEQDIEYFADGAALVINPKEGLERPTDLNQDIYRLSLTANDVLGGSGSFEEIFNYKKLVAEKEDLEAVSYPFGHPDFGKNPPLIPGGVKTSVDTRSPYILGLYPGFPCLIDFDSSDLAAGILGRCKAGITNGNGLLAEDDLIPLPEMPSNRPIVVYFSKPIREGSIINESAFYVNKVSDSGVELEKVPGVAAVDGNRLQFYPDAPWQPGGFYKYTLRSNGGYDRNSDGSLIKVSGKPVVKAADCSSQICDYEDNPLHTDLLTRKLSIASEERMAQVLNYQITPEPAITPNGGGESLEMYFVGASPTSNVLQALITAPVADVNSNLQIERSWPLNNEEIHFDGFNSWKLAPPALFTGEEGGSGSMPDNATLGLTDPGGYLLDPDGVVGAPNSIKILPSSYGGRNLSQMPSEVIFNSSVTQQVLHGANVGCGFSEKKPFDDQTGCNDQAGWGTLTCFHPEPLSCPEEKFSYASSVLFADVMNEHNSGAVSVRLYPGHVVATSFWMVLNNLLVKERTVISQSGPQVMRLRYADDGSGSRRSTIPGSIVMDQNGRPRLNIDVDMYLDAPEMADQIIRARIAQKVPHNLHSYELPKMSLSGEVEFLNDGRMVVNQLNENEITVGIRAVEPTLWQDIFIPVGGSRLQYVSESIK